MQPEYMESLKPPEQHAVKLIKTAIDCFNTRDGIGRFSGPARYHNLEAVLPLAATQAQGSLTRFWGVLLKKMMWPSPPKRMDEEIISLITSAKDERLVLKALMEQPASICMLARYWHSEDKRPAKELEAEWQAVLSEGETNV